MGQIRALNVGILAAFLAVSPAFSFSPDPINLGSAGKNLTWRLYLLENGTWERKTTLEGDVSFTDLGDGDYSFSGLPSATGEQRYWFVVTEDSGDAGLRELTYGALPGQRITWEARIATPSPVIFMAGQTHGSVTLIIESGLVAAINSPSTIASFSMSKEGSTGEYLIDRERASISDFTQDDDSGTYGATLEYQIGSTDWKALQPGIYNGVFWVTFADNTHLPLPTDGKLKITIKKQIGTPLEAN